MNFGGGASNGSRNSSNNSRNNSNNRAVLGVKPYPSYQRPTKGASAERIGSGARSNSNTRSAGSQKKDKYLPASYKPPH